ncbi:MAG: CapA family protein [Eubacteriaceae bacterium]|uniref:CapA family protein n=1 Tax=Candidatus Pseudoramibacter fermentans TaxID=2594427 RepID=A0A6L5GPP0_9FIRM|nr:CapA family protein [Candidatus Pseudoramibacter fermentans]RRF92202.1 MAG: CapA family protein [Eubacteriaceae bacterium]
MHHRLIRRILPVILLSCVLCAAALGGCSFGRKAPSKSSSKAAKTSKAADKKTAAAKPAVDVTFSAAGDCTLGVDSRYSTNFNSVYQRRGAAYFLKNVRDVFSADDLTVVNLEGTLTTSTDRAVKTFTFKGPAEYTDILKNGSVEAVTIANNHSHDFGDTGFSDTQKALDQANIPYFGYNTVATLRVRGEKFALIGINGLDDPSEATLTKLITRAKKQKPDAIIVYYHWGIERNAMPEAYETALAKSAIDHGADLVLGSHPHVVQGIEMYKGRYIVYSLGNFCFGGNTNPSDKDSMIFQLTFHFENGKLTATNGAKVLPCSISSSSSTNDFQPRVLTGSESTRVLNKISTRSRTWGVSINSDGTVQTSDHTTAQTSAAQ